MGDECEEILEIAEGPSVCAPGGKQPAEYPTTSVRQELAYGIKFWAERSYIDALEAVRTEIENQGLELFGEWDIHDYLKRKLGVDVPRHHIIAVSSPDLVYRALSLDKDLGLLLPVNIVLYEQGDGTVIECIDPITYFEMADGKGLEKLSRELKAKLEDVISHVAIGVV